MTNSLLVVIIIINFVLVSPQAFASGGMAGGIGTFTTGVSDRGSIRYKVELDEVGQFLHGKANSEVIELIILYAPGTGVREILVRETRDHNGIISLLLSAPDGFVDKFQHATIYLKPNYAKMVLIENIGGRWEKRDAISIPIAQNISNQAYITAFHISSLGESQLVKETAHLQSRFDGVVPNISHQSSSNGNITSALWPWLMSCLLLMLAWVVSRWMHVLDWRGGR